MARQVSLYKISEVLETARILDSSVLEAYNESIKSYNSKIARVSLGEFGRLDGELTGSSPFMLIQLANSNILQKGERLATIKDLKTAILFDNNFLRGNYADFGLALLTAEDSYDYNNLLAKKLTEQLKNRGINIDNGKLIDFNSLELKEDSNSEYGLILNLTERASKDNILDLAQFKLNYARNEGLAGASFSWGRSYNSNIKNLANSISIGRVVVITPEGTPKKL